LTRAGGIAIALWLALLAASAALVWRTPLSTDLSAFLPRSPTPAQQLLVDQLREGIVSRLVLVGIEGAAPPRLAARSEALRLRLARDPAFVYVNNGAQELIEADGRFLFEHRYLLSPEVAPARFTAPGLRAALEADLALLASPTSMLLTQVLPADPTGELLGLLDTLQGEAGAQTREGVWFSRDGKRALLIAQTGAQGFDIDGQQAAIERLRSAFAATAAGEAGVELLVTGPGVFAVGARTAIKQDAVRLSAIAVALVAALLLLVYRSLRVLALALLPAASGALAGAAGVSLVFGSIHGVTLGFGVTLIGEADDYAIYLFTHLDPAFPPERTLRRLSPILGLGVLTSVCGFGALLFSGFPGLAQLGVFSMLGLIVAVLVARFVLPALLPPRFGARASDALAAPVLTLAHSARRLRVVLLAALALGFGWLVLRGDALWNDDLSRLSPVSEADKQLDRSLRTDLGAPDVRQLVVVSGATADAALESAERVGERLRALQESAAIAGFDSPARYLPSLSTQRARQTALPDAEVLRRNLTEAARGLPFRDEVFEPFLEQTQAARARAPVTRSDLDGTGLALKVDSLLVERRGNWFAMLPLRGVNDPTALASAAVALKDSGAEVLDLKREADALYRGYRSRALTSALLGAGAIAVLLLVGLRSVRRAYDVLVPLAAAVVATCAVLAAAGVALTLFHLVGLLLVVAVGSNYSLFFERDNLRASDPRRTLAAVLLCNLSTAIGFGLLAFSRSPVLSAIGGTVAIGAVLSLVFAALLTARIERPRYG
jgi:predicted exporter